jgi:hypothetical protein
MKKLIKKIFNADAHRLVLGIFIPTLMYVLLYELWLVDIPASSKFGFKIGLIISKIGYSIIAASIFYLISQYIPVYRPRQQRKIKILFEIYQKTLIINSYIGALKLKLNISESDFKNSELFKSIIHTINPDKPIDEFADWHHYLFYLKSKLLDIVRSMTFYHDYLSKDFLHELIIMERQLLSPHTFEGYKTLGSSDLSYAEIDIQELLVHNKHLQDLREKEFRKYEEKFKVDGGGLSGYLLSVRR